MSEDVPQGPPCEKGCLDHLDERPAPDSAKNPFLRAIQNDHLECFRYADLRGCSWNGWTCEEASKYGRLDFLRYAHENGCQWDKGTCSLSSLGGHLDCLRYAHENGCPWDKLTCSFASLHGRLDCLRYARENGCEWTAETCAFAGAGGSLDCLRYAHENGCPWDVKTCAYASHEGHLDCLRYAHENGCPWDARTCLTASLNGKLECLRYALENGCPSDLTGFVRSKPIHRSAVPILYHHGARLPEKSTADFTDHIREHARQGWLVLRCAVRWLRMYDEACFRVYAPEGVGYRMAETSFLEVRSRIMYSDAVPGPVNGSDRCVHPVG